MPDSPSPYLSVVVTTRNDDHGGDPLKRLQALVNTFDEQCRRTGLAAELIVVEWNPPADRPRVGSLLRLPQPAACTYRFIEVPADLHDTRQYADVLPLFQMIAKNVGIRRARGAFVLATNIDIVFSNELVEHIAARCLQKGCLYRVDRHDIEPAFPIDSPLADQLEYCRTHQLRIHTRDGSFQVRATGEMATLADDIVDGRVVRLGRGWHVKEGGGEWPVYRWASDRAELIVDSAAAAVNGAAIIDVDLESSPYDAQSWFEVEAIENGCALAHARVAEKEQFEIPIVLRPDEGARRIELHVRGFEPASRRHLPTFERRDSLHYRVAAARLRPAGKDDRAFEYPPAGWTNAFEHSRVRIDRGEDGVTVSTDPRKWSYAAQYGPLRVDCAGLHKFVLEFTVLAGGINIGLLSGDRTAWLPASIIRKGRARTRFDMSAQLEQGQVFWIVISNDAPEGEGISRAVLHRLRGSIDPVRVEGNIDQAARPAVGWRRRLTTRVMQSGRRVATRVVDKLVAPMISNLHDGIRYRVVRRAPEYQAVESALRSSDAQLRALAPLRHLAEFDAFLRDRRPDHLHVNGCGDFQLMAREHWHDLRAYAEFETFSMNIDGLMSYVASAAGVVEEVLPMPIYHLEHEVGSGWSPEGEAALRKRIADRGITWIDASTIYTWAAYMRWLRRPMIFNGPAWGFGDAELPERTVFPDGKESAAAPPPQATHPVFDRFERFEGWAEPGFERSYFGINVRDWIFSGESKNLTDRRYVTVAPPPIDEEYFERIALLTSILHARGRFCFAELGAGWGRWMVSAAVLCRQKSVPFSLVGVEPEPSHFEWLRMVLRDNDVDPDQHELFLGAVMPREGDVVLAGPDTPLTTYGNRTIGVDELPSWKQIEGYVFRPVSSITLDRLFEKHDRIDLVDMDVQGEEGDIVAGAIDLLDSKVRMVHIGTHSAAVEAQLIKVFTAHHWLRAWAYPGQTKTQTPFGVVSFGDGAQTWVNPRWPELYAALLGESP